MHTELLFKPIQKENYDLAYAYLKDSFEISFGLDQSLWPKGLARMSMQDYFDVMDKKQLKDSDSVIHVWQNEKIIGQIEMHVKADNSKCGYISLYYLVCDKRGMGLGKILDEFATSKLKTRGCHVIELTVERSNKHAISFYKKQGWVDNGIHPSYGGLVMKKQLIISEF